MTDSKEQILTCARDLFLDEGLSHFSMRKVAQCAGLSATAIYRHYTNKDELLFNVLLHGFRLFTKYLDRVSESQKPLACLKATALAYLDFALDERAYYEVMFMSSEQITGLKRVNEDGAAEMQQTFETLQRRVQRAIDSGVLSSRDSYQAAFGIWAYAHGQISLYLGGRTEMNRETFIDNYRQMMTAYLKGQ